MKELKTQREDKIDRQFKLRKLQEAIKGLLFQYNNTLASEDANNCSTDNINDGQDYNFRISSDNYESMKQCRLIVHNVSSINVNTGKTEEHTYTSTSNHCGTSACAFCQSNQEEIEREKLSIFAENAILDYPDADGQYYNIEMFLCFYNTYNPASQSDTVREIILGFIRDNKYQNRTSEEEIGCIIITKVVNDLEGIANITVNLFLYDPNYSMHFNATRVSMESKGITVCDIITNKIPCSNLRDDLFSALADAYEPCNILDNESRLYDILSTYTEYPKEEQIKMAKAVNHYLNLISQFNIVDTYGKMTSLYNEATNVYERRKKRALNHFSDIVSGKS